MDRVFPLGFPGPTALYLILYVATLTAHVVFMNYVLAGTAVVAANALASVRRRATGAEGSARVEGPLVELLRDWLSFALSAAITAGIAPLLLIQVLYRRAFYTANLLLSYRWMLILPALIAGFYLLYALKTRWIESRPRVRLLAGVGALLCFGFTALSWTENYLLARNSGVWASLYASGEMAYRDREIAPRLLLWSLGAFPTLGALLGWQVLSRERRASDAEAPRWASAWRPLSLLALGGLMASVACAAGYAAFVGPAGRAPALGPAGAPYVAAALLGAAVQAAAWTALLRGTAQRARWLGVASAGLGLTLVGTSVVREVLRIAAVDFVALYPDHARAAEVGGRWVFLGFFVVNAALATWAIRTVLREVSPRGETGLGSDRR